MTKPTPSIDEMMAIFVTTVARKNAVSMREKYLLRETMHSLVRLSKSEQMLQIKLNINKLIPASIRPQHIRRSRSRHQALHLSAQGNLAFGSQDCSS